MTEKLIVNSNVKVSDKNKASRDVIISFQEQNNAIHSALALLLSPASSSSTTNIFIPRLHNYINDVDGIDNTALELHIPTFAPASTMSSFSPFAFLQHFNYRDLFTCSYFIRFMIK